MILLDTMPLNFENLIDDHNSEGLDVGFMVPRNQEPQSGSNNGLEKSKGKNSTVKRE